MEKLIVDPAFVAIVGGALVSGIMYGVNWLRKKTKMNFIPAKFYLIIVAILGGIVYATIVTAVPEQWLSNLGNFAVLVCAGASWLYNDLFKGKEDK